MSQARQAAGLIKTPLGEAEIRTRKLAVRGVRRQLLILTNGEHDRAALVALAGKIGASEEDVDQLLGLGLIAAASDPEPATPPAVGAQVAERDARQEALLRDFSAMRQIALSVSLTATTAITKATPRAENASSSFASRTPKSQ